MKFEIDLMEGKYKYYFDNGRQYAYRNGEPWREQDLLGDNLVYSLAMKIYNLENELENALNIIEESGVDYNEVLMAYENI